MNEGTFKFNISHKREGLLAICSLLDSIKYLPLGCLECSASENETEGYTTVLCTREYAPGSECQICRIPPIMQLCIPNNNDCIENRL